MITTKIFDENGNVVDEHKADYMAAIFYTDLGDGEAGVGIAQKGNLNLLDCVAVMASVFNLVVELSDTFSRTNDMPKSLFLSAFSKKLFSKIRDKK